MNFSPDCELIEEGKQKLGGLRPTVGRDQRVSQTQKEWERLFS